MMFSPSEYRVASVLVCALLFTSCLKVGCGSPDEESAELAFDTQALYEKGIRSIVLHTFYPSDVEGNPVNCEILLNRFHDLSEMMPVRGPLVRNIQADQDSFHVVVSSLPPQEIWFLVLGFDKDSGDGDVVSVGCGRADIERGSKKTAVVVMEEVP